MIALLRKRLACRDAEFAELDEAFIARENLVLESESSLPAATSMKAKLYFSIATLQTDLSFARASLAATRSSADSATLTMNLRRSDNERLESQVSEFSAIVNDMRLQLATTQSCISPVASYLLCSECDRYLGLLRSLIG